MWYRSTRRVTQTTRMNADDADPLSKALSRPGLIHGSISKVVLDEFFRVFDDLGPGLPEYIYQEAMARALRCLALHAEREVPLLVFFRGAPIGRFRADLIVEGVLLLELKAVERILEAHQAQVLTYLKVTDLEVGLLLNFGSQPDFRRLVFSNNRKVRAGLRSSAPSA